MSIYHVKKFFKQQIIFKEKDKGDSSYIIRSGKVGIYKNLRGQKTLLAVLEQGDILGEMALLNRSIRSATAQAIEFSELVEIERGQYLALLKESPKFIASIITGLIKRLEETTTNPSVNQMKDPLLSVCEVINLIVKANMANLRKSSDQKDEISINYKEATKTIERILPIPLSEINNCINKLNDMNLIAVKAVSSANKIIEINNPEKFLELVSAKYQEEIAGIPPEQEKRAE